MDTLAILRKKIDRIDQKIGKLLQQRAKTVTRIINFKKKKKLSIIDKKREQEILNHLKTDYEKNIFKSIICESRKLQKNNPKEL